MRKRRGPYSDPRQGSILKQIDNCFTVHNTDTLDASVLMNWAYGPKAIRKNCMTSRTGKRQKWLKRALLKVATPIGRSPKGSGRPMPWKLDPEKAALRGWSKPERQYEAALWQALRSRDSRK
jgi:hypothetical protein